MDIEHARDFCLALPETTEGFPFGPDVLVFKVAGRMFATLAMDEDPARMNVKCDPDDAVRLRDEYECVEPGYHMNKRHWNTLVLDGSVVNAVVEGWIRDSWTLVARSLKKADRVRLLGA